MSGSASHSCTSPPAPTASRVWSSSPAGRRIWRHTTPVTTSDSTYGAKNSVRSSARPAILALSSSARPRANGIWSSSESTMIVDVVPHRVAEQRVVERPTEVVEADELVERLEPVPVEHAVAHALHDRVEHEQRRRAAAPAAGRRRSSATACGSGRRCDRPAAGAHAATAPDRVRRRRSVGDVAVGAVTVQQRWSGAGGRLAGQPPTRWSELSRIQPLRHGGDRRCRFLRCRLAGEQQRGLVVDRGADLGGEELVEVQLHERRRVETFEHRQHVRVGDGVGGGGVDRQAAVLGPGLLVVLVGDELEERHRLRRSVLADREAVAATEHVGRRPGAAVDRREREPAELERHLVLRCRRRPGCGTHPAPIGPSGPSPRPGWPSCPTRRRVRPNRRRGSPAGTARAPTQVGDLLRRRRSRPARRSCWSTAISFMASAPPSRTIRYEYQKWAGHLSPAPTAIGVMPASFSVCTSASNSSHVAGGASMPAWAKRSLLYQKPTMPALNGTPYCLPSTWYRPDRAGTEVADPARRSVGDVLHESGLDLIAQGARRPTTGTGRARRRPAGWSAGRP